jgi:hypothetical protein
MRDAWVFCCSILPPGSWSRLAEPGRLQAQAARAWREGRGLDLPPSRILSALSPFASAFAVAALEARPPEALGSGTVRRWEKIWLADLPADPDGIRGLLAGIEQEAQRDDRARRIPPEMLQAMAERIAIVPSGLLAAAAGTGERWRRPPRLTRMRVMWRRAGAGVRILAEAWRSQARYWDPRAPQLAPLGFPESLRAVLLAPDRAARLRRLAARGRALAAAAWGPKAAAWLPEGLIVLPRRKKGRGFWAWEPGSGLRAGGTPW